MIAKEIGIARVEVRKVRKGADNLSMNVEPDQIKRATVDRCNLCGKDLSDQHSLETSNELCSSQDFTHESYTQTR